MQGLQLVLIGINFVGLVTVSAGTKPDSGSLGLNVYDATNGGYSVRYPASWRRETAAHGFRIYNFREEQQRPQLLLPDGGALIAFAGMRKPAASLDQWAEDNAKLHSPDSKRTFLMGIGPSAAQTAVTETVTRWSAGRYIFASSAESVG